MRTFRPAQQLPPAYRGAEKDAARDITNKVLCKVFPASHGPSQQPAAPRDRAHCKAAAMTERTDKVLAANSSKAPAACPTLRGAQGVTGAASRAPAPASLGRHAGPGHQGQAAQQDPPTSPIFSEQAPAAEAERQAPAPYTPREYEDKVLQDTPAPSTSPAAGWQMASSTAASGCLRPVPPARGINGERGRHSRVRSFRPAQQLPPAYSAAGKDAARDITNKVLCKVFPASHGPSQQPAAPRDRAHCKAAAMTERTDKVLASNSSKASSLQPTEEL